MKSLIAEFGGVSVDGPLSVGVGREVVATHFDILGLNYEYYGVTKGSSIATYPMIEKAGNGTMFGYGGGNAVDTLGVDLDKYPSCCTWKEQTSDHLTQVFFLCKDEIAEERVKEVLLTGSDTGVVLPKIRNNYKSANEKYYGDANKFNNIALYGPWIKGSGPWTMDSGPWTRGKWDLDRVRFKLDGDTTEAEGSVYHVTNERVDSSGDVHLDWHQIRSRSMEACHYHGALQSSSGVCFVTSTLYRDDLPTRSMYPHDGIGGAYYSRIKIPAWEVSSRLGRIFYWCSAPSVNGVGQMHYICGSGSDVREIRDILDKSIHVGATRDLITESVHNDYDKEAGETKKNTYNIIAVPRAPYVPMMRAPLSH